MKQTIRKIAIIATAFLCLLHTNCSKNDDPVIKEQFIINIEELTSSKIKACITPKEKSQVYFSSIIRKSDFVETWNNDVSKYLSVYIDSLCEKHSCTIEEAVAMIKHSGESMVEETSLIPSITYVILVAGIDNAGKPTTEPTVKDIITKSLQKINCDFDIKVSDINISKANIHITPSNKDAYYMWGVVDLATFPSDPAKHHEFAQNYVNKLIMDAAAKYEVSYLDAIHFIRVSDQDEMAFQPGRFFPNKQYLTIAMCVDNSGYVRTDVATMPFSTLPAKTSSNTFDATVKPTSIGCIVDVMPSNSDPYFVSVVTTSSLEGKTDQQLISEYIVGGANSKTSKGQAKLDEWKNNLISGTEFTVLVFGCDQWATTPVKRVNFKTDSGGDPALCSFKFDLTIDEINTTYSVTPSDTTVFYYRDIRYTEQYQGDSFVIDEFKKEMEYLAKKDPTTPIYILLARYFTRGVTENAGFFNFDPALDITIYAFAIDPLTAKIVSPIIKQNFAGQ